MRPVVAITLLLLLLVAPAQADPPFEYRTKLVVTGDDEFASELRRVLREIPGVVVTSSQPTDIINVNIVTISSGFRTSGLVAALTITGVPTDVKAFWETFHGLADCNWKHGRESAAYVGWSVADRVHLKGFNLFVGPPDRFALARRIAAYIDEQTIEPSRQAFEDLKALGTPK